MPAAAPLLDPDSAAFVQGGVSIVAASCNAGLVPSIGRVCGCRVTPDPCVVTVLVAASQAADLVADVRASGRIAVVFSRPTTHRTLQLKAERARVRDAGADDAALAAAYVAAFAREIEGLGHDEAYARVLLKYAEGDLVAIEFEPSAAFEQTPGPKAGTPLAGKP